MSLTEKEINLIKGIDDNQEKLRLLKEFKEHPGWAMFLQAIDETQEDIDKEWRVNGEKSEYCRGQREAYLSLKDILAGLMENFGESTESEEDGTEG